jgi:hypothetical protein
MYELGNEILIKEIYFFLLIQVIEIFMNINFIVFNFYSKNHVTNKKKIFLSKKKIHE